MADINVERKGPSIWPWIIGLLVLALLIWALVEMFDSDEPEVAAVDPVATAPMVAPGAPEPIAQGGQCVGQVMGDPTGWAGRSVSNCQLQVTEVISDRGFWVEEQGQRMLVVINEGSQQNPQPGVADVQGQQAEQPDVNAGQTVTITEAMVHDATQLQNLQGALDDQLRNALQGQQVFLVTDGRNIQIGQGGM